MIEFLIYLPLSVIGSGVIGEWEENVLSWHNELRTRSNSWATSLRWSLELQQAAQQRAARVQCLPSDADQTISEVDDSNNILIGPNTETNLQPWERNVETRRPVVWGGTEAVGCGRKECQPGMSATVCMYSPRMPELRRNGRRLLQTTPTSSPSASPTTGSPTSSPSYADLVVTFRVQPGCTGYNLSDPMTPFIADIARLLAVPVDFPVWMYASSASITIKFPFSIAVNPPPLMQSILHDFAAAAKLTLPTCPLQAYVINNLVTEIYVKPAVEGIVQDDGIPGAFPPIWDDPHHHHHDDHDHDHDHHHDHDHDHDHDHPHPMMMVPPPPPMHVFADEPEWALLQRQKGSIKRRGVSSSGVSVRRRGYMIGEGEMLQEEGSVMVPPHDSQSARKRRKQFKQFDDWINPKPASKQLG